MSSQNRRIGDRRSLDRCPFARADLRVYWRPLFELVGACAFGESGLVGHSVTLYDGFGRAPPDNEFIDAIREQMTGP